jgi:hypothetical protein
MTEGRFGEPRASDYRKWTLPIDSLFSRTRPNQRKRCGVFFYEGFGISLGTRKRPSSSYILLGTLAAA